MWTKTTKKENEKEKLINLNDNFRSASAVINMVNKVFIEKMKKEDFGIDYKDAKLVYGGLYKDKSGKEHFCSRTPKAFCL